MAEKKGKAPVMPIATDLQPELERLTLKLDSAPSPTSASLCPL